MIGSYGADEQQSARAGLDDNYNKLTAGYYCIWPAAMELINNSLPGLAWTWGVWLASGSAYMDPVTFFVKISQKKLTLF